MVSCTLLPHPSGNILQPSLRLFGVITIATAALQFRPIGAKKKRYIIICKLHYGHKKDRQAPLFTGFSGAYTVQTETSAWKVLYFSATLST